MQFSAKKWDRTPSLGVRPPQQNSGSATVALNDIQMNIFYHKWIAWQLEVVLTFDNKKIIVIKCEQ